MKFLDIIKNKIEIPLIQRDYVQGLDETKAKKFLEAIKDGMENNGLNLDFIYGSQKDNIFIPIDGQQRLTTLFLLYYYLSLDNEYIEKLQNFSYAIRPTSKDFIENLTKKENWQELSRGNIVSNIKNSNWYFLSWENDLTIKSMLNMLDLIEQYFKNSDIKDLGKIEFYFLDLEEYSLNEDLYIKMNARGKQLDDFENFKAKFEKYIDDINIKAKFDNEWLDFFWNKFKNDNIEKVNIAFYNFVKFLAEMISYKNGNEKEFNYDFYKIIDILSDEKNYFINVLDNLEKIDKTKDMFSENYEKDKVTLFRDVNFFDKIIMDINNASIFQKIILFQVINYILKFGLNDGLKDYIRVVRNILWQDKSLKQGQITYTQTITTKEMSPYLKLFEKLLNQNIYQFLINFKPNYAKNAVELEKEKAKLINKDTNFKEIIFEFEDLSITKGDIKNFLNDNINKFRLYLKAIKSIFGNNTENNDSTIIRAMLTIDDYTISIGWSYLNGWKEKFYFGRNRYLDIVIQAKSDEKIDYKVFWQNFLDKYSQIGLEKMIAKYLEKNSDFDDWKYYFIKYSQFTQNYSYKYISKDRNVFTFYEKDDIWYVQEKLNNTNAIGYHINPFIYTVNELLNSDYAVCVQGDNLSYLEIDNNIITFENNKWKIEGDLKLIENKKFDKIEIMTKSIKQYLNNKN